MSIASILRLVSKRFSNFYDVCTFRFFAFSLSVRSAIYTSLKYFILLRVEFILKFIFKLKIFLVAVGGNLGPPASFQRRNGFFVIVINWTF